MYIDFKKRFEIPVRVTLLLTCGRLVYVCIICFCTRSSVGRAYIRDSKCKSCERVG